MPKQMSQEDAARIQSSQAKAGRDTGKGSFSSRAQSVADSQAAKQGGPSKGGKSK